MRAPSLGLVAGGAIALTVLVLASLGAPIDRPPPPPVVRPTLAPASVAAGGVTLVSQAIALPDEPSAFPAGPHADLVTADCTACHSASMVLAQPHLSAEQWQAEVTKMREAYKAPVADADVPTILAYLQTLPGQGGERSTPPR